eukprot:3590978-Amphidinium_carterae.2
MIATMRSESSLGASQTRLNVLASVRKMATSCLTVTCFVTCGVSCFTRLSASPTPLSSPAPPSSVASSQVHSSDEDGLLRFCPVS